MYPVKENTLKFTLIFVIGLLAFNCAGQVPPSGGPPDKTPPNIIATSPELMALNFKKSKFSFLFDKYIERMSFQESFFVSPSLSGISYDWSGTEVEVSFEDTLRPRTTYIITIGTDVKDTRGNRFDRAFSLPFSTGDFIDSCVVVGSVTGDNAEGVMIFAYDIGSRDPDTLNPAHSKPDFLTQTGTGGTFRLPYLPVGSYRIIAVRDEYKNLLYEMQVDHFGIYTADITLSAERPVYPGVQFKLAVEDTAPPFISSVKSLDQSHVLIRFSEEMDEKSIIDGSISIFDTLSRSPLEIQDISFGEKPVMDVQVLTASQDFGRAYRLIVTGVSDISGNFAAEPRNSADFNGSPIQDTSRPAFELTYPPVNRTEIFTNDTIRLFFSEAVRKNGLINGIKLMDSSRSQVLLLHIWTQSRELLLAPREKLLSGMSYDLTVQMDSVSDIFGNTYTDSVARFTIETVDDKTLSSISGTVSDDQNNAAGRIFITAKNISRKDFSRLIILDTLSTFNFDKIPEGEYTISAFRDEDGNGAYSFGRPFPFNKSERFAVYRDTLKLRARWPLEGVAIRFPE